MFNSWFIPSFYFSVLHAVDLQHVGEGRVALQGFDGGGGKIRLEGVHAGGDEGEVFGAEVVGLEAAVELLVLPVLWAQRSLIFIFPMRSISERIFSLVVVIGFKFQGSGFKFNSDFRSSSSMCLK